MRFPWCFALCPSISYSFHPTPRATVAKAMYACVCNTEYTVANDGDEVDDVRWWQTGWTAVLTGYVRVRCTPTTATVRCLCMYVIDVSLNGWQCIAACSVYKSMTGCQAWIASWTRWQPGTSKLVSVGGRCCRRIVNRRDTNTRSTHNMRMYFSKYTRWSQNLSGYRCWSNKWDKCHFI